MRKILTKLVTMLIVAAMAVSTFAGCGLITTNQDRDMAQIVATVQISDDITAEEIEKKEMISGFISYGYMYVQQYGYTTSQAYEMVLKNLIQNRVIVQQARKELAKRYNEVVEDDTKANSEFLKYFKANAKANGQKIDYKNADEASLEKYLTEYEILQAKYAVRTTVNSIIDQYVEEDKDKKEDEKEDETFTPRKTPVENKEVAKFEYELANFNGEHEELSTPEEYDYKKADVVLKKGVETLKSTYTTLYALNKAVYTEYKIDLSTSERRKAFTKAIKTLKDNGLISDSEKDYDYSKNSDEVLNYSYFKDSLISQYESVIVSKYEASLIADVELKFDGTGDKKGEAIWDQYLTEYLAQKAKYEKDITSYETALDAVTDDVFVVCNPYAGYGYVANLLIGFTDEQAAQLKEYQSKKGVTDEEILAMRSQLLNTLVAKDQRETWVYSSYGQYNKDTDKFAFEDKYLVSEKDSDAYNALVNFGGKVYGATSKEDENDDKVIETKWSFSNVIPATVNFADFVENFTKPLVGIEAKVFEEDNASTVGMIAGGLTEEKRNALDDLMFAFSTDPGSLGNYFGYTYSPFTSDTKYVKEFAAASKAVVNAGKGAYTIVATDFGYHIIVCTEKIDNVAGDIYNETSKDKFIEDLYKDEVAGEKSFAKKYREIKLEKVTQSEVNKIANNFINAYMEDEAKVKKNPKTYGDLITEPTKEDK